jgi:multidrug efflux pump subunit AcrA (membrane-fusion protein)
MKILKWTVVIVIAFGAGFAVSHIKSNERIQNPEESVREEHSGEDEHLDLSKKSQGIIDLKTMEAKREPLIKKISVVGQIAQESETVTHITACGTGVVLGLKVEIGSFVEKGDVTALIKNNGGEPNEVKSPVSGIVVGSFTKEGDKVDSVSNICTIADLSKLSATFDVYEKDIAAVKSGQKIQVRSVAYPDKVFEGEIVFVSHRVDRDSRTIKIRGLIRNPEYLLKLGMFVNAEIEVVCQDKFIIVPQESVQIMEGKKVVFIKTAEEKFEPREIKIKDETKDKVAIFEGINQGEAIVIQGGFLLKSELLKSKMGLEEE